MLTLYFWWRKDKSAAEPQIGVPHFVVRMAIHVEPIRECRNFHGLFFVVVVVKDELKSETVVIVFLTVHFLLGQNLAPMFGAFRPTNVNLGGLLWSVHDISYT